LGNISKLSQNFSLDKEKAMLKKKLKHLVTEKSLSATNRFEVIADLSAGQVIGGVNVQDCPKLTTCKQFSGTCPNLTSCEQFG